MADIDLVPAINLIKKWEGLRLKSYQDQKGVWTVGYGATGSFIGPDTVWTEDQSNSNLLQRVNTLYSILKKHITPMLTNEQWAAIISLTYNVGVMAFLGSSLANLLNKRDFTGAAKEFLKWDHCGKEESLGLLNRREDEMAVFMA